MSTLRVGTRGSELALIQTRLVVQQLRQLYPDLMIEEIILRTQGDRHQDQPLDTTLPRNAFVGALEDALLAGEIDVAVHSYKDLPSRWTPGTVVAAVPKREMVHDVLVSSQPVVIAELPETFTVGTASPRRIAQLKRQTNVRIVAIRGNVPTRLEKVVRSEVDAVVLAAAGLHRLGLLGAESNQVRPDDPATTNSLVSSDVRLRSLREHLKPERLVALPTDTFIPAAGQGALALQTREDGVARALVEPMNHIDVQQAVDAERMFMMAVDAGCDTPVGALAIVDQGNITLRAQLFDDLGRNMVVGEEVGEDPSLVGQCLGKRLANELKSCL